MKEAKSKSTILGHNTDGETLCERHLGEIEITKADAYYRQWCLICQEKCPFFFTTSLFLSDNLFGGRNRTIWEQAMNSMYMFQPQIIEFGRKNLVVNFSNPSRIESRKYSNALRITDVERIKTSSDACSSDEREKNYCS